MLPGALRDAHTKKVLYRLLQPGPEDRRVLSGLLVLRRAEEVDDSAGVQTVSQDGMAHLTLRVCPKTLQEQRGLSDGLSPHGPALRCL